MNPRFKCGLVVGKFCPLHLGHEYLIQKAQEHCDELILISYTKPGFTGYERHKREIWLHTRFPTTTRLVLDEEYLATLCQTMGLTNVQTIPHNDTHEDIHRNFVAWLCTDVLHKKVDSVFTSEDYGDGFAARLSEFFGYPVAHLCIDKARKTFPVSGTQVRLNPHEYRHLLSPQVYGSFVQRITLLGGESTGKTTLSVALAERLQTLWTPEYGRELWEQKSGKLVFEDMAHIGKIQVQRENQLIGAANRFLICDTTPLTTLFYSDAMFGRVAPELAQLAQRPYHHIFLCVPDFDFVPDETRQNNEFRLRQHLWYQEVLLRKNLPYTQLNGTPEQRINCVLQHINAHSVSGKGSAT